MRFQSYCKRHDKDLDPREVLRGVDANTYAAYARLSKDPYYGKTDRYQRFYCQVIDVALDLPVCAFHKPMVELGASRWPLFRGIDVLDRYKVPGIERPIVQNLDEPRWDIPDAKYGVLLASHCLEHLADKPAALAEMCRIADWLVIALPLGWTSNEIHRHIYPSTLAGWAEGLPMTPTLIMPSYGCTNYEQFVAAYRVARKPIMPGEVAP